MKRGLFFSEMSLASESGVQHGGAGGVVHVICSERGPSPPFTGALATGTTGCPFVPLFFTWASFFFLRTGWFIYIYIYIVA